MAEYIQFYLDSDFDKQYQDWRMIIDGKEVVSYAKSKSANNTVYEMGGADFYDNYYITLEAKTNWLTPYPSLKPRDTGTLNKQFQFGDSSMSLDIQLGAADMNKVTTATVGANQIKRIKITNIAYYVKSKPKATIVTDLQHCTLSPAVSEIEIDGESHVLTLAAESGYRFVEAPTIGIDGNTRDFIKDTDTLYSFDLNSISITEDVTVTIKAVAVAYPIITIERNLSGCTMTPAENTFVLDGTKHILTVTPNSGYKFSETPKITLRTMTFNFTPQGEAYVFDLADLYAEESDTYTVTAVAVDAMTVAITYNIVNSEKADNSPLTWRNGDIDPPDIHIRPLEGYVYNTPPKVTLERDGADPLQYDFAYNVGLGYWVSQIPIIPQTPLVTAIIVEANAVEQTKPQENYAFLRLHKMTEADLLELSKKRFIQNTLTGEYIDIAQYILNIYRYPFKLSTADESELTLGAYATGITTPLLAETQYVFETEAIKVAGLYGNAADIHNAQVRIYLPLHGFEVIESRYINTDISVRVTVEVMTNQCIFAILSNGDVIAEYTDNIADTLPYILKADNVQVNGNININIRENRMFVEVLQKPEVARFAWQTKRHVNELDGLQGYIKTQNYSIQNIPTVEEAKMIESLMNSGVYI